MAWFKRDYRSADYRQDFDCFEQHGPRYMMMISIGLADARMVYLSLPDPPPTAAIRRKSPLRSKTSPCAKGSKPKMSPRWPRTNSPAKI
jgi:hypothetical protein